MPQIEIPNVDELASAGLLRRFASELLDAEFGYAILVLIAMSVVTVVFADPLTPFYSFNFVFGAAATFFFGITFSTAHGLVVAGGQLALMLCVNWAAGTAPLHIFLAQAPFLAIFLGGLALLPNLMPWIMELQTMELEVQNRALEAKVQDLEHQLASVQKEAKSDRFDKHKMEAVKFSTRTAVLHAFARELLQSASQREILNVLFYNFTRVFGVQECAMLIHSRGASDVVIARIAHPKHGDLENTKLDLNLPLLRMVFESREPVYFSSPESLREELSASLLVPILVDGEIYAIFTLGKTKSGDLQREEADFVIRMSSMAVNAIEQLKAVLAT